MHVVICCAMFRLVIFWSVCQLGVVFASRMVVCFSFSKRSIPAYVSPRVFVAAMANSSCCLVSFIGSGLAPCAMLVFHCPCFAVRFIAATTLLPMTNALMSRLSLLG